jgi:hypothetical protein
MIESIKNLSLNDDIFIAFQNYSFVKTHLKNLDEQAN